MTEVVHRIRSGDARALGRLLRGLDDGHPGAVETLSALCAGQPPARLIGLTGIPGAGKSTLTACLVKSFRDQGLRVGVVAVDPSSPFSGGAILGDRIRMQAFAGDPDVFIRSVATRGTLGGLTKSCRNVVKALSGAGFDVILIETVGVGQDEVDIVHLAETNVVLTLPGTGDGVQAIKAGLLEIADIFVVNKADLDGATQAVRQLEMLLGLEGAKRHGWPVPVLECVATRGEGVDALVAALAGHAHHLSETDEGERRSRMRVEAELREAVRDAIEAQFLAHIGGQGVFDNWVSAVLNGRKSVAQVVAEMTQADEGSDPPV
jgi:LAO/AO transport system kinase